MSSTTSFALEIGTAIAASSLGGIVLGLFLDAKFGWKPFGTLIGAFIGITLSIAYLVIKSGRLMKQITDDENRDKDKNTDQNVSKNNNE